MAEKTVNYTAEQTAELVDAYTHAQDAAAREAVVQGFAENLGKTVRSVRAKLVREGVYVKKEYKTKTGGKAETKEEIVASLAEIMGADADTQLSGLEKATKRCLQYIRKTMLIAQSELLNSDN